jgi:hypothetical protein
MADYLLEYGLTVRMNRVLIAAFWCVDRRDRLKGTINCNVKLRVAAMQSTAPRSRV